MSTQVRAAATDAAPPARAITGGGTTRRALFGYLAALGLDRARAHSGALEVFRRARRRSDLPLTEALWEELWQFVPPQGWPALPPEAPLPMPEHDLRAAWAGREALSATPEPGLLRDGRP